MGTTGEYSQRSRRPVTEYECTVCGKRTFNYHIMMAHGLAEVARAMAARDLPSEMLPKDEALAAAAKFIREISDDDPAA